MLLITGFLSIIFTTEDDGKKKPAAYATAGSLLYVAKQLSALVVLVYATALNYAVPVPVPITTLHSIVILVPAPM